MKGGQERPPANRKAPNRETPGPPVKRRHEIIDPEDPGVAQMQGEAGVEHDPYGPAESEDDAEEDATTAPEEESAPQEATAEVEEVDREATAEVKEEASPWSAADEDAKEEQTEDIEPFVVQLITGELIGFSRFTKSQMVVNWVVNSTLAIKSRMKHSISSMRWLFR